MGLQKIDFRKLGGKAKETYNFQKVSALLVDYGFATNWLNVDFESADFIAVHFNGIDILKVQLKSRVTIDKKYLGKSIWMTFPVYGHFYLIPHDELIIIIEKTTNWLQTDSWMERNAYSSQSPSKQLLEALASYKL